MEGIKGVFYAVGIGPGDPELLTVKAVKLLERCPVIAAPRTRSGEMLALRIARQAVSLEGKTVLPLFFPMCRDKEGQRAAHEAAAAQVASRLDRGEDVAMLNLGDVSIYATCSYVMELLREQGYRTEMVPGVPSFCAVAARLGISLTTMNAPLHLVPAGGGPLEEALAMPGTKVLMKSASQMGRVLETLRDKGLLNCSAMVQDCGLPGERVYETMEDVPDSAGYFATIVVKG